MAAIAFTRENQTGRILQQAKQTTNEVVSQGQQQASSEINRQKDTASATNHCSQCGQTVWRNSDQ